MNPTPQRIPVLIVVRDGDWIEAFAPDSVSVHIVNLPHTGGSLADEIAGEEWLDETLPRPMANVFEPGNLRATGQARIMRPSEIAEARRNLAILHAIGSADGAPGRLGRSLSHPISDEATPDAVCPDAKPDRWANSSPAIRRANKRASKHVRRSGRGRA